MVWDDKKINGASLVGNSYGTGLFTLNTIAPHSLYECKSRDQL